MTKIDLHVIRTPKFDANMEAMLVNFSPEFFDIHICDRVDGNITEARRRAFRRGTNELKTFIDPDDEILDLTWISKAIEEMSATELAAIACRYKISYINGKSHVYPFSIWTKDKYLEYTSPPIIHHLSIMRSRHLDVILETLKNMNIRYSELFINQMIPLYGDIKIYQNIGYHWILRPGSAVSEKRNLLEREALFLNRASCADIIRRC